MCYTKDIETLCPDCCGDGIIQIKERVSRDMASDYGDLSREGEIIIYTVVCPPCRGTGIIDSKEERNDKNE